MVSVEKYDCTVLCSDRPNGALTCQSEQEGREWEKTASEAEKRKDTSILRHTHTHIHLLMSCPWSPGRNTLLPHTAQQLSLCVCVCDWVYLCLCRLQRRSRCVCMCVCISLLACAHMHWSLSPCLPRALVNLCCVRQATITATITTPSHSPPRPYPRPPRAPWGGAAWWSGRNPPWAQTKGRTPT